MVYNPGRHFVNNYPIRVLSFQLACLKLKKYKFLHVEIQIVCLTNGTQRFLSCVHYFMVKPEKEYSDIQAIFV